MGKLQNMSQKLWITMNSIKQLHKKKPFLMRTATRLGEEV